MAELPEAVALAKEIVASDAEREKPPGPLRIHVHPLVKRKEPAQ